VGPDVVEVVVGIDVVVVLVVPEDELVPEHADREMAAIAVATTIAGPRKNLQFGRSRTRSWYALHAAHLVSCPALRCAGVVCSALC
jgi:hypothetical protein